MLLVYVVYIIPYKFCICLNFVVACTVITKELTHKMNQPNRAGRRRHTEGDTRTDILMAAQQCFAKQGYTHATLRTIGAMANVNPSLIVHYFGSKKQLFIEASFRAFNTSHALGMTVHLSTVPQEQWGTTLADLFVVSSHCEWFDMFLNLLRASADDPKATETLIAFFRHTMMDEIQQLGVSHAEQRATLLVSCIIGIHFTGHVLHINQLVSAPSFVQHALFAASIQSILTMPIHPQ